ncbi:MAG: carboxylesterase family protein [Eubacteriales bacterium]|nr:carboxylesterase family protein [Eubacteriales bacterium]
MNPIQTTYGKLTGIDHGSYLEYRGVPYAQPPIGELRWKAPQPPKPWEGVRHADTYPPCCMQPPQQDSLYRKEFYENPDFNRIPSEDCLYLNIWTPKEPGEHPFPVAFWIHGGAFLHGYATELEFDGAEYAKRGVILVSVEYRCNLFGFLAHPWLSQENERGISGNYGILDQIAALDWVAENIAAFGGDPKNITVFGQSAGAMSTQTLLTSKLAKGNIAKAILQSGGAYQGGLSRDMPLRTQESYGEIFAELAGASSLSELRALPAERILELMGPFFEKVFPLSKGLFLVPVQDGYVLDCGYDEAIAQGMLPDIPLMLGTTKDDLMVTKEMQEKNEFSALYKGCIAWAGQRQHQGSSPTWVYYFTRDLPGDDSGAFHSSELWYMFGTLGRCWRPMEERDYRLSSEMLDYWTNFMKYGNPNGDGLETWEPCDADSAGIKEFC